MTIRLSRIKVENFKPFEEFIVDFTSQNLIVFDGPNGFGKTSFYDAIELLFTGCIRRYSDLVKKAVDKRRSSMGSPLLNDRGTGDLVIKGELIVDGMTVCLARKGSRDDLLLKEDLNDLGLRLYKVSEFDSDELVLIDNEEDYLAGILGKNYANNFEYLNYIEQEENIYLLKDKEKDRKDKMAHLFNTLEFNERIKKLIEVSKKIGKLCGKEAKDALKEIKKELDECSSKFSTGHVPVPFFNLITSKDIAWDQEKLEFSDEQFVNWLGDGGELDKLEFFIVNIDEYRKDRDNKKLDKMLANEDLFSQFLMFWNFFSKADDLNNKLSLKISIDNLLQAYDQGAIEAIKNKKVDLIPKIQELLNPIINVGDYSDLIVDIINVKKNSNTLSKLLIDVKDSRLAFINRYLKYESEVSADSSCPLCGYSWGDEDELKLNFDAQAKQIEELIIASGNELNLKLEKFVRDFITPIKEYLEDYQAKNYVDTLFVNKLNSVVDNRASLDSFNIELTNLGIDFSSILNDIPSISNELKLEELNALVKNKKNIVNHENIRAYFSDVFLKVFDENYDCVSSVDKSLIPLKRKYIEWQYSIQQSESIKKMELNYKKQTKTLNNAVSVKKKIDNLKKIYETSLKAYQKSLIENIEILFHIYSGRIAQEGKGSLGLFIDSDKNGIRFLENHAKNHDAIFTMSSGQLATLVIAFTLALNKRYSNNKLLFIDDPIQTLDELNIAGLVELLRNEFSDCQIFISTHEDTMSAYMRYKFQKYGLGAQRLSFKESQLAVINN